VRRPSWCERRLGESIEIRSMAYLALSYDHRLVDGGRRRALTSHGEGRLEAAAFADEVGGVVTTRMYRGDTPAAGDQRWERACWRHV
jgi:hypothetical protein